MLRMIRLIAVSYLFSTSIFYGVSFAFDATNGQTIPEKAIHGWSEMSNIAANSQGSFVNALEEPEKQTEVFIASRGELRKIEYRDVKTRQAEKVDIVNDKGFTIVRVADKWQLSKIAEPAEMVMFTNLVSIIENGFRVHGLTKLQDISNDSRFTSIDWQEPDDGGFAVLKFKCQEPVLDVEVRLENQKRYRVREVTCSEPDLEPFHYLYEYEDDSTIAEVVPRSVRMKGDPLGWETLQLSQEALPEKEFSIEFYGLPPYLPRRGIHWSIWIILTVLLGVIFASFLRGSSAK